MKSLKTLQTAVEKKWAAYLLSYNETGRGDYRLSCYKKTKFTKAEVAANEGLDYDEKMKKVRQDWVGETLEEVFEKALQNKTE